MRNKQYWIDRAERRMDGYVASAFDEARVIGRTYRGLKNYITSEMAKILRHIGDEDSLAYEYRMKRLNALLLDAERKYKEAYGITLNSATEFLKSIIPEAYYHTIFDIAQGFGVQPEFATIPTKLVNTIINEDWSGKNYSKRLWANTEDLAEELREVMTEAAVTGESIGKTSRKIAEKFDQSEYNARRLVRTETTYVTNKASLEAEKELDIDKYQFIATYNEHTCKVCQKNDQKIFESSKAKAGVNFPPMHPHCPCTHISYFEDFTPPYKIARDKDGNNIQIPANMSYDEWYNKYIKVDNAPTRAANKSKATTSAKPSDVVVAKSDKQQGISKGETVPKKERFAGITNNSDKINKESIDNTDKNAIIKKKGKFNPLSPSRVVNVLRENSKAWINKLTSEEVRALRKYTKNSGDNGDNKFFARLNAMLRGEVKEDSTLKYYSDKMSSAIAKYDLKHDIVCYRAVDIDPYAAYKVGDIIEHPQFISTSVVESKALKKPFKVKINVPKGSRGAYIENISKYPDQREFIIDKQSMCRVVSKKDNFVELELIT